jgi:type I restriction enzyme, S subunit
MKRSRKTVPSLAKPLTLIRDIVVEIALCDPRRKPDEHIRYVDLSAIDKAHGRIASVATLLGKDAPSRARQPLRAGDVIFATTRPNLKSAAIVPDELDGAVASTGFCVLRASDQVEPAWLFYALYTDEFMKQLLPKMRGATHPAVGDTDVLACEVPLPEREVQQQLIERISEAFARIGEMEHERNALSEDYTDYFARFLADTEARFAKHHALLADLLADTQNGKSLKNAENEYNCRALTLSAVRSAWLSLDSSKLAQIQADAENKYLVRGSDVFISRSNTKDLVALSSLAPKSIAEPTIFSDLLIRLTPHDRLVSHLYLVIALRFPGVRKQLQAQAVGSSQTMVKISGERLRTVSIPLPSLDEQQRVEEQFAEISEIAEKAQAELKALENECAALRQAILREAFAGKL